MATIKFQPHGRLSSFNFQLPFTLSIKAGNNVREFYDSQVHRTRLEAGIFIYNGDVVRFSREMPTRIAQAAFGVDNVSSGSYAASETVNFSGPNERVIEATATITGDANDSVVSLAVTRSNNFL